MDYLHEPEELKVQLDSLLDDELSGEAADWPCKQGAPEPLEKGLELAE